MSLVSSLLGSISEAAAPQACFSVDFISNFDDKAGHTVYQIEVTSPSGTSWTIQKRYSEVRELHDTLRLWLGDRLPPIPGRRLFGNHDPSFIVERQMGLQRYLNGTLQLIASQMPSLLGFIGQFLGCTEQTRRGRTQGAAPRREIERKAELSAPPAPLSTSRFYESVSNPRATSLETATAAASRNQTWVVGGTPALPTLSRSVTPHNMQPRGSETTGETRRPRRWSRQGGTPLRTSASCDRPTMPQEHQEAVAETVAVSPSEDVDRQLPVPFQVEADAVQQHPCPAKDSEDQLHVASRVEVGAVPQHPAIEETCEKLPVASHVSAEMMKDSLVPSLRGPSPAPHGDSWDWPLSRHEKKERVRLIDQHVTGMERQALMGEIEQLRSGRDGSIGRMETPCKDRHSCP